MWGDDTSTWMTLHILIPIRTIACCYYDNRVTLYIRIGLIITANLSALVATTRAALSSHKD